MTCPCREALERAAKVCENMVAVQGNGIPTLPFHYATAIRSLPPCNLCSTHVMVPKGQSSDSADLLNQLVRALDTAFISTWQSTAAWNKELTRARDWLAAKEGEK